MKPMEVLKAVIGLLVVAWILIASGKSPAPVGPGMLLLGLVVLSFLLAWSGYESWQIVLGRATLHWRRTKGSVRRSWISEYKGRRGTSWSAHVEYEYEIGSRRLESDRFTYQPSTMLKELEAKRLIERFPTGQEVAVYYDPANLERAVLLRGASVANLLRWVIVVGTTAYLAWMLL